VPVSSGSTCKEFRAGFRRVASFSVRADIVRLCHGGEVSDN
jgi:hypothetical protein